MSGHPGRAVLAVALGAALLGFAPIGLRLSDLGPQATAVWRFAFALPVLGAAYLLDRRSRAPLDLLPILALAGVSFGLDIAFWHAALTQTTVLNATLASNMTPLIAAAAGWFLFRERIGAGYLLGAGVALVGALLLSLARARAGGETGGAQGLGGDILGLVSAVWYAAYLIILRGARARASAIAAMFVTTAAAGAFALCVALAFGEALWPHTARGWGVLIGLGLVVHVGGQGLIAYGLGKLPIALSTVLLWVQPIAAAGLSWILFGEALTPLALGGAVLVLAGVWIVQSARSVPQRS